MKDDTGHVLIGGARWHWPAPLNPSRCGVPGCTRKMSGHSPAHVGAAPSEQ